MHATLTPTTRRIPISLWVSVALFLLYSVLGVSVCLAVGDDARYLSALLTASPLMFLGMIVCVIDIVRTRKRGGAEQPYIRLQWVGLALMAAAMPLWLAIAVAVASLP
ncbi:hypothetical protein E3O25_06255 [Cryobacterium sp. TMT1-3]|uniref:Uncharacterized protein n=1 Tax=Cryobacterium luteum TaxID=1424661 RepID=A0A1H8FH00_9MICO|nr:MULTISPECIES: hypothetical protein [Cryobacterium]TFB93363.1 hypothetical protein E3O10_03590 [Cryobacterium luteum]TFC28796.1 hypothetical protein E3O25_06255 [Cryobacterium sp. TMT1-3]SEN31121.1 hypothetical protein SAMN05216281_10636 [Cryobacterium luteum]